MAGKQITITPNTLIPISALVAIVAGVFWLSVLYSDVQSVIGEIESAKVFRMKMWEHQISMDRRLAHIEGKILEIVVGGGKN
jgi:hypothetical protein